MRTNLSMDMQTRTHAFFSSLLSLYQILKNSMTPDNLRITDEIGPSGSSLTTQDKWVVHPKSSLDFVDSRWRVNSNDIMCSFWRPKHVLPFLITRRPFQWRRQRQAMGNLPLFKVVANGTAVSQILFLGKNSGA